MKTYKSFDEFKIYADHLAKKYYFVISKYNEDYSIDVDGNVYLNEQNLNEIPIQFNIVSLNFYINTNQLKSLEGCPRYVGRNFACYGNFHLRSHEGAHEIIRGDWFINNFIKEDKTPEYQKHLLVKKIEKL